MSDFGGMQRWDGTPQAVMRASDADRERAIDVLKAGFSEGRLSREEYEQRVGSVYRARTYGELASWVRDLPQGPVPPVMPVPVGMPPVAPTFLPVPVRPTSGLAVGSLLCGLAGLIFVVPSVPAIVLGHLARGRIRRTGEEGEGVATAGAVLGWLALGFWTLVFTVMLSKNG